MCHGLASHKRLRDAICTSVPKSSFLNRFIKNYKTYSLKYKPVIYSYYSRHVLLLSKKRRGKEFKVMKNEKKRHSTSASSYNLRGDMFWRNSTNSNMLWNILVNKMASIGRVPFDCGSSCVELNLW